MRWMIHWGAYYGPLKNRLLLHIVYIPIHSAHICMDAHLYYHGLMLDGNAR